MQIKAHILANKTQFSEPPEPMPGEEVTAGVSWSYTSPTVTFKSHNSKSTLPVSSYSTGTPTSGSPWYYDSDLEGCIPSRVRYRADCVFDVNPDDPNGRKYQSVDVSIENSAGSVTLNVSNVPPGRYVVVVDYWLGCTESSAELMVKYDHYSLIPIMVNEHIKTEGPYGTVYGDYMGTDVYGEYVQGGYERDGAYVHIRQKFELKIQAGVTQYTFNYGDDVFGFNLLASFRLVGNPIPNTSGRYYSFNSPFLAYTHITPKLYKKA